MISTDKETRCPARVAQVRMAITQAQQQQQRVRKQRLNRGRCILRSRSHHRFHPGWKTPKKMAAPLLSALMLALATSSCQAINLRGMVIWLQNGVNNPSSEPRSRAQQPNTLLALFRGQDAEENTKARTCQVDELLAWSDNVRTISQGSINPDEGVILTCKPGFIPPPGSSDSVTVKCYRGEASQAFWELETRLNCGLPCSNSELVSELGVPVEVKGVTAPQGRMAMRCALHAMHQVTAECRPDGTWASTKPCEPCDSSSLLVQDTKVVLSAQGMMAPLSKIQMSCPSGKYAYPASKVDVVCQPGGTWSAPPFDCRSNGCDTADFFPSEVDSEKEGLLAVGANVLVRKMDATSSGVAMTYFTSTCREDGTWSSLNSDVATRDIWDGLLPDSDFVYES